MQSLAMQESFGCTVTNRFDQLLDDEADPLDVLQEALTLKVQKTSKKKKIKDEEAAARTAKTGRKETQKERKSMLFTRASDEPAASAPGRKRPSTGDHEQNENRGVVEMERNERRTVFQERRLNQMEPTQDVRYEKPSEKPVRGSWSRGGGTYRTTYTRNTDGFDHRGKRDFDRQSGTDKAGVRPDDKRGGRGQHNWGSLKDPVSFRTDGGVMEESSYCEENPDTTETEGENLVTEGESEPVPEVIMEMSLDEWKAIQEQSRSKAELKIRKPDSRVPSKAVVIHKSRLVEDMREDSGDENSHFFRRPANDITSQLDINFGSLSRPSRGRGGRGGRTRTAPPPAATTVEPDVDEMARVLAPDPDDMEDFPALA